MKKNGHYILVIFLCVVFSSSKVIAQEEFAPIGAKWWYEYSLPFQSPPTIIVTYSELEVIKDTLIHARNCRKVEWVGGSGDPFAPYYFNQQGHKIYYYYEALDSFILLYDFELNTADSYSSWFKQHDYEIANNICGPPNDPTYLVDVTVQSSELISYNGIQLVSQNLVGIMNGSYVWHPVNPNLAIERMGSMINFLPSGTCLIDIPQLTGLRCYQDDVVGLYNTGIEKTCDTTYNAFGVGIYEYHSANINISPNPASTHISIELLNEIFMREIRIMSSTGQDVLNAKGNNQSQMELDISNLPNGMYFLMVIDEQQNRGIKKLIIAR